MRSLNNTANFSSESLLCLSTGGAGSFSSSAGSAGGAEGTDANNTDGGVAATAAIGILDNFAAASSFIAATGFATTFEESFGEATACAV